jgi:exopolysaccharide production protein ExoQ
MAQSGYSSVTGPAHATGRRARSAAWIHDNRYGVFTTFLVWLLILRIIIPGFFDYSNDDAQIITEGVLANTIIWLFLLFAPLAALLSRLNLTWQLLRSLNIFFILLIVYVGASVLWSIDPSGTSRKFIRLLTALTVCMAACLLGWQPRRFQELLRPIITIVLVGSLIFCLMYPDLAITPAGIGLQESGNFHYWRGLTQHKNALGALAGLGLLFWFHAYLESQRKLLTMVFGMGVSLTCLYLAHSSTSVFTALFAAMFLVLMHWIPRAQRRYSKYIVVLFVAVIACYTLAVLKIVPGLDALIDPVTSAAGKDVTFTGRTVIWEMIKQHIALSPIHGTGYGAFWTGPFPTSPSYIFKQRLYFYPGESHNGYLDVINDLGYIGLILLGAFIVSYIASALRLMKIDRSQALLYLALIFQQLMANLAETSWLQVDVIGITLMFATIAMARGLLDAKLHQTFGSPAVRSEQAPPPAPPPVRRSPPRQRPRRAIVC